MLSIHNLSFHHKGCLFSGVSLDIPKGSFLHLEGPNGSGKTSFLRILAGLIPSVYSGRVGGEVSYTPDDIGICLTGPWAGSRLFCRTVREEISFSPGACAEEGQRLLEYFGISGLADRHPQTLSGGQQQLVLLIAYLSCKPALILLDECFAPLSNRKRGLLSALLADLHSRGRTIVLVEHQVPETLKPLVRSFDLTPHRTLRREKTVHSDMFFRELEISGEAASGELLRAGELKTAGKRSGLRFGEFSLCRGDILYVRGSVGCGKTTLLKIIAGLLEYEGNITLEKRKMEDLSWKSRAGKMGVILQDPDSQFCCNTVEEEIFFSSRHLKRDRSQFVTRLARVMNLDMKQNPFTLSHGEKKKCQLAAALALEPDILLLDEPDAGLDSDNRRLLVRLICHWQNRGGAVMFTSHNEEFAGTVEKEASRFRSYSPGGACE